MPRVDPEAFADVEVRQIYLARGLDEAKRVEAVLDGLPADYAVRVEAYTSVSWLFFWPQKFRGAAFYVPADGANACGAALRGAGLHGVVDEATDEAPGDDSVEGGGEDGAAPSV